MSFIALKPWGRSPVPPGTGEDLAPHDREARQQTEGDIEVIDDQAPEKDKDTDDRRWDEETVERCRADLRDAGTPGGERDHHDDGDDELDNERLDEVRRLPESHEEDRCYDELREPVERCEEKTPYETAPPVIHELDETVVEVVHFAVDRRQDMLDPPQMPAPVDPA